MKKKSTQYENLELEKYLKCDKINFDNLFSDIYFCYDTQRSCVKKK